MIGYVDKVRNIQSLLVDFKQKGVIDKARLGSLDDVIRSSYSDEFRVLNTPRLSLDEQRSLFGAFRNMHTTTKAMKAKLETASEGHENPSTANLSLEFIETLSSLAKSVDQYLFAGRPPQMSAIDEMSRAVYKKAKRFGFWEDTATQFRELNLGPQELKNFTEKLNKNIEAETDIDEDVGSTNEDID